MKRRVFMQEMMAGTWLLSLLLAACGGGPTLAMRQEQGVLAAQEKVIVQSKFLEKNLVVDGEIRYWRSASNLLHVQVPIRNTSHDQVLNLQLQTLFKDEQGRVLSQAGEWDTLSLTPGSVVFYQQSAMNEAAADAITIVRSLGNQ